MTATMPNALHPLTGAPEYASAVVPLKPSEQTPVVRAISVLFREAASLITQLADLSQNGHSLDFRCIDHG